MLSWLLSSPYRVFGFVTLLIIMSIAIMGALLGTVVAVAVKIVSVLI